VHCTGPSIDQKLVTVAPQLTTKEYFDHLNPSTKLMRSLCGSDQDGDVLASVKIGVNDVKYVLSLTTLTLKLIHLPS
jgi:hypothetical protein